jgi:hypothetical protein
MPNLDVRLYNGFMWFGEQLGLLRLRRHLLQQARGQILELGVGTGINLPLYRIAHSAEMLVGLDVNRARLAGTAEREKMVSPTSILQSDAQALPFPDNSFDTVVSHAGFLFDSPAGGGAGRSGAGAKTKRPFSFARTCARAGTGLAPSDRLAAPGLVCAARGVSFESGNGRLRGRGRFSH